MLIDAGQTPKPREHRPIPTALGALKRRWLSFAAATAAVRTMTCVGVLLLVIPGLVAGVWHVLYAPVVVLEPAGIRVTLRRARRLTRRRASAVLDRDRKIQGNASTKNWSPAIAARDPESPVEATRAGRCASNRYRAVHGLDAVLPPTPGVGEFGRRCPGGYETRMVLAGVARTGVDARANSHAAVPFSPTRSPSRADSRSTSPRQGRRRTRVSWRGQVAGGS